MEEIVLKYGLAGVVILALVFAVRYQTKQQEKRDEANRKQLDLKDELHRCERDDWRKDTIASFEKITQRMDLSNQETKAVINTSIIATVATGTILTELRTLINTMNK